MRHVDIEHRTDFEEIPDCPMCGEKIMQDDDYMLGTVRRYGTDHKAVALVHASCVAGYSSLAGEG